MHDIPYTKNNETGSVRPIHTKYLYQFQKILYDSHLM